MFQIFQAGSIFFKLYQKKKLNILNSLKNKKNKKALQNVRLFYCGPTWARTKDHLIMSQVL